jgi:hypothetical protein
VTGGWKKLDGMPRILYSSLNIIRVIEIKGMRRTGHIPHGGDKRCIQNFGWKA